MRRKRLLSDVGYRPPKVWRWEDAARGACPQANRSEAGPTHTQELPVGRHPLQLYSLATPNGIKVTIMLEELLALGKSGAEYDAHLIRIGKGEQFGSGFVSLSPNAKIPVLLDTGTASPIRVFESGAILLYLAEKFQAFIPSPAEQRTECLNWLFWQVGAAPFVGGGLGHFYAEAPEQQEYPINRFTMMVKRQLDVLDRQLGLHEFVAGSEYTIADMAIWPWYSSLVTGESYDVAEFLDAKSYTHLTRWVNDIGERPTVKRGRMVNRAWGDPDGQLPERHDASDFLARTGAQLATHSGGSSSG